jgi:AAA domain
MSYVEAAIDAELAKLRGCPPGNQEITVNEVAFALAGMINGGWPGAEAAALRPRFIDAVLALTPSGKPWTLGDASLKWRNACRDAKPRPLPHLNGSGKTNGKARGRKMTQKTPVTSVTPSHVTPVTHPIASLAGNEFLPDWTPPGEEGRPVWHPDKGHGPAKPAGEIRRHLYVDDKGRPRRAKIKVQRKDGVSWTDWYLVRNPVHGAGWQARKPTAYVEIPYFLQEGTNPFDAEFSQIRLYQTEGEKDAENIARAQGCAFSFGGSSSIIDCSNLVHGRDLVILADNDDAGRKWVQKQARLLADAARSLKIYTFPDLKPGGDASDFLENHSLADLDAIIDALPEWRPDIGYDACMIRREIVIPPAMLIKRVLPVQGLVFIAGQSESGKTYAAISLAAAVAAGKEFLGCPNQERAAVIYCAAEGEGVIDNRFTVALDRLEISDEVAVMLLRHPGYINEDWEKFKADMAEAAQWLKKKFKLSRCVFILDTRMAGWRMEDENSNEEAGQVCAELRSLGPIVGGPVIVVHHYGKTKEQGLRGASAWTDNCDHVISLTADKNNVTGEVAGREIAIARSRFSATGIIGKFELKYQKLGVDQYGDEFGDCSIQLLPPDVVSENQTKTRHKPRSRREQIFHNALNNALIESGVRRHVHRTGPEVFAVELCFVRANFNRMYASGDDTPKDRQLVTRVTWKRLMDNLDIYEYATETEGEKEWIWKLKA